MGLTIRGLIEWRGKSYGPLIVLCHGFKALYKQPQIAVLARRLVMVGYTVVSLDATNSVGTSDGKLVNFTVGGYIQDIKQVMGYALRYTSQKRCVLIGYSIGAMAGYVIASQDKRVRGLALQGPSYRLGTTLDKDITTQISEKGWARVWSNTLSKFVVIGGDVYRYAKRYDVDEHLRAVKCPVLVTYGTYEEPVRIRNMDYLYRLLRGRKKIVKILSAPHTFRKREHINLFVRAIIKWLSTLPK